MRVTCGKLALVNHQFKIIPNRGILNLLVKSEGQPASNLLQFQISTPKFNNMNSVACSRRQGIRRTDSAWIMLLRACDSLNLSKASYVGSFPCRRFSLLVQQCKRNGRAEMRKRPRRFLTCGANRRPRRHARDSACSLRLDCDTLHWQLNKVCPGSVRCGFCRVDKDIRKTAKQSAKSAAFDSLFYLQCAHVARGTLFNRENADEKGFLACT